MVSRGGLCEAGESARRPVEGAAVNNHTPDRGAVPANPLGAGLHDNVAAVLERLADVASGSEGVVTNKRDLMLLGNCRQGSKVGHVVLGVANGLNEYCLCVFVNKLLDVCGVVTVHEFNVDAHSGELHLELVVGAAVEVGGGHDVIPGLADGLEHQELRSHAGCSGQGHDSALKGGNPLFKHVAGGVHDARVNVAKLLEAKKASTMLGVVEDIRGGGVDGYCAGIGGRVRVLATMHHEGLKPRAFTITIPSCLSLDLKPVLRRYMRHSYFPCQFSRTKCIIRRKRKSRYQRIWSGFLGNKHGFHLLLFFYRQVSRGDVPLDVG
mmetsp:Transcript_27479/g.37937  ORF Transcript_27479/g.37937 Transcript_27479/m.37937 type:complete len:323 (+) Transcript_27479:587-1555(+)